MEDMGHYIQIVQVAKGQHTKGIQTSGSTILPQSSFVHLQVLGKSVFTKRFLEKADQMIQPPPQWIIWCCAQWQPLYQDMLRTMPGIEFIKGIPPKLEDDSFLDINTRKLIGLDNLMSDFDKDQRITDLYTKGSHHRILSVITLMQNFYEPNTVTIRRNAHYMVLFNMPADLQSVKTMSQHMFPHKPNYTMEEYKKATVRALAAGPESCNHSLVFIVCFRTY